MAKEAVGFIETVGLVAAMEAADAAVKSANVNLVGYELTKGNGMVTVKIEGDVGAVKAAVAAANSSASNVGDVYAVHVIPRLAAGLDVMLRSTETVGWIEEEQLSAVPVKSEPTLNEMGTEEPNSKESDTSREERTKEVDISGEVPVAFPDSDAEIQSAENDDKLQVVPDEKIPANAKGGGRKAKRRG